MEILYEGKKIGYQISSDFTPYDYIIRHAKAGLKHLFINREFLDLLYNGEPQIAFRIEDGLPIMGMSISVND